MRLVLVVLMLCLLGLSLESRATVGTALATCTAAKACAAPTAPPQCNCDAAWRQLSDEHLEAPIDAEAEEHLSFRKDTYVTSTRDKYVRHMETSVRNLKAAGAQAEAELQEVSMALHDREKKLAEAKEALAAVEVARKREREAWRVRLEQQESEVSRLRALADGGGGNGNGSGGRQYDDEASGTKACGRLMPLLHRQQDRIDAHQAEAVKQRDTITKLKAAALKVSETLYEREEKIEQLQERIKRDAVRAKAQQQQQQHRGGHHGHHHNPWSTWSRQRHDACEWLRQYNPLNLVGSNCFDAWF